MDEYLTAHSHADPQRAAELEKSELGAQVSRLLGEFDAVRDRFDLRGSMRRPNKLEMYTKMVTRCRNNIDTGAVSTAAIDLRLA